MGGGWVLEADIRDCFGTLDHAHLREILHQRIRDGVLLRLIGKWLNAGVLEGGQMSWPESGTPQGGVISPLLANVYLHTVLDVWFAREVKPKLRGQARLIRYADDFVILLANEADAHRVHGALPARFASYGLTLHPGKTKLLAFRPPTAARQSASFDFLGFTHFWSRSLRGNWVVKRQTAKSRLARSLKRVTDWCRANRHLPIREQHAHLSQVIRGHCGYFGITGNSAALQRFWQEVRSTWRKWLRRRSNQAARNGRAWWDSLCERYPLPRPYAVHSVLRPR
jgi:group II intron reverse transcriptase/maturase